MPTSSSAERPEQPFALFEDGRALTFGELATRTWTIAHALRRRVGIGEGEIVAVWLPNGEEALLAWFAANAAGCVFAPLNTAYRGRLPAHALAARARQPGRRVGSRGGRHRAAAGRVLMSRVRGRGSPWPTTSATRSSRRASGPEWRPFPPTASRLSPRGLRRPRRRSVVLWHGPRSASRGH